MDLNSLDSAFKSSKSCAKNIGLIKNFKKKDLWKSLVEKYEQEGYTIDYDESMSIQQICKNIRRSLMEDIEDKTYYPKPKQSESNKKLLSKYDEMSEEDGEDTDVLTKMMIAKYITNTGDIDPNFIDGSNTFKRFMLGKLLEENNVEVTNCDLSNYFLNDSMTYLAKKNSASISVQGFASYNPLLIEKLSNDNKDLATLYKNLNREAFLKMYKISKKELKTNNGLNVELEIYKRVTPHMIENHYSPHVIVYIASFQCPVNKKNSVDITTYFDVDRTVPPASSFSDPLLIPNFADMLEDTTMDEGKPRGVKTAPVSVIVTEKAEKAETFGDWLKKRMHEYIKKDADGNKEYGPLKDFDNDTLNSIKLILFQLYYTLEVFNRYGLKHNDLHSGNIWIEPGNSSHVYWYAVEDSNGKIRIYKLPASIIIKLYDFDRSVLNKNTAGEFENRLELINTSLEHLWIDRPAPEGIYTHNEKDPLTDTFKVTCALKTDLFYDENSTDKFDQLPEFYKHKITMYKDYEECKQGNVNKWIGYNEERKEAENKFKEIAKFIDNIMDENVYNERDIGAVVEIKKKIKSCDLGSYCFPQGKPGTQYMKSTLDVLDNEFFKEFEKTDELLQNPADLSQGIQFIWALPGLQRKELKKFFINISDINIPIKNYERTLNE